MSEFPTWRRGVNWTNRVSYYSIGLNIYFFFPHGNDGCVKTIILGPTRKVALEDMMNSAHLLTNTHACFSSL